MPQRKGVRNMVLMIHRQDANTGVFSCMTVEELVIWDGYVMVSK